jgi:hypothetical protein
VKKPKRPKLRKKPEKQQTQLPPTPENQTGATAQSLATAARSLSMLQGQPAPPAAQSTTLTSPAENVPRRHWSWSLRVIFLLLWSLLIVALDQTANIVGIWGPFWPVEPIFSAGAPAFGFAFDIPFSVTNKSSVFPIRNLTVTCVVSGQAKGSLGTIFSTKNASIHTDVVSTLSPLETAIYSCPLRGAMRIDTGDAADVIKSGTVKFRSKYDARIWGDRAQSEDGPFTLITTVKPPRWERGNTIK